MATAGAGELGVDELVDHRDDGTFVQFFGGFPELVGISLVEGGSVAANLMLMTTYKEIAFTAYAVTNMRKARAFYEGVLCLKVARKLSKDFVEVKG